MKRFLFFLISSVIISAVAPAPGFSWIKLTPRGRVLQKIGHTVIIEAPKTPSDIAQQIEILKGLKSNNYMHENDIFIFRTGNSKEGGKKLDYSSRTALDSKVRQALRAVDEAERLKKSQSLTESSSSVFNPLTASGRPTTSIKADPSRDLVKYLHKINLERQTPDKISKISSGPTEQARDTPGKSRIQKNDNSEVEKLDAYLSSRSFGKPVTSVEAGISKGNGGPSTKSVDDRLEINSERRTPDKPSKISFESTKQARDQSEVDKLESFLSSHTFEKPQAGEKAGTSKENTEPKKALSRIDESSGSETERAVDEDGNEILSYVIFHHGKGEISARSETKPVTYENHYETVSNVISRDKDSKLPSRSETKQAVGEDLYKAPLDAIPHNKDSKIPSGSETKPATYENHYETLPDVSNRNKDSKIPSGSETKPATYENHYETLPDVSNRNKDSKIPSGSTTKQATEEDLHKTLSDGTSRKGESKTSSGSDTGESVSVHGQPINQGNQVPASGYLPWDNVLQIPVQKTAKGTGASTKDHGPKKLPEIDEDGYAIPSEVIRSKPAPEPFPVPDIPVKGIGNEFITDKNTGDYGVIIRIPKETKSDQ